MHCSYIDYRYNYGFLGIRQTSPVLLVVDVGVSMHYYYFLTNTFAGSFWVQGSWSGSSHSSAAERTLPFQVKGGEWEIDKRLLKMGERIASGSCGDLLVIFILLKAYLLYSLVFFLIFIELNLWFCTGFTALTSVRMLLLKFWELSIWTRMF